MTDSSACEHFRAIGIYVAVLDFSDICGTVVHGWQSCTRYAWQRPVQAKPLWVNPFDLFGPVPFWVNRVGSMPLWAKLAQTDQTCSGQSSEGQDRFRPARAPKGEGLNISRIVSLTATINGVAKKSLQMGPLPHLDRPKFPSFFRSPATFCALLFSLGRSSRGMLAAVQGRSPPKLRAWAILGSFCANFNVEDETNHDRTGKLVVCRDGSHAQGHEQSMLNKVDIDFRIPGLPHSAVKQAQNSRDRELVKKIENHPHRPSRQRDLQQKKAYNPFSTTSKKMVQDVGNVELFELFETDSKTQCKECLSYWTEGIVYCTCGHLLKEIAAKRGVIEYTLDFLSIPEYIIKKGRPHGHRYGKTPGNREYHLAHNLKKRCIKKNFKGNHDRFLRDPDFRTAMLEHDRDEEVCIKMDDLADKDFSHYLTESEYFRYKQNWWISLKKNGNTTEPLRNRSDFNEALSTLNRLHQEFGERPLRPLLYWMYQERHPSSNSFSSWWQWSGSWWSS